jgi:tetratricopeptide (TPR) repeat protein
MHLREMLCSRNTVALMQPQAISGLGGIGKTQTAIEYAYRYRAEYSSVLWTRADSAQALISGFVAFADLLQLPERNEEDQQRIVGAVKRWLQMNAHWLLILDNADDLESIYDYLVSSNGHILVTTRASATGPHIDGIELVKMDQKEGILLLLQRSKRLPQDRSLEPVTELERGQAAMICSLLDGLPLALDQAAAYIEENQCSLGAYLNLYRSHRAYMLQRRGVFGAKDYPHSVATTWSLSFEQLERTDPVAADLLRLCAFLHPDAIPEEMIVVAAPYLSPRLQQIAGDPALLDAVIGALRRFSLIRRNAETKTLTIHRLVQAVLRDAMEKEIEREWAEWAVHLVSHAFPEDEFSKWRQCESYLPHALIVADLIEQWDMKFPEAARLLSRTGDHLYERGQYKEAESLCQRALRIREQALGPEHPEVAQSLNSLAVLYITQHLYERVESLCLRALSIQEQALGPQHTDVAVTLNDLAMLYYLQGKYEQVEPLYQRALSIFRNGPETTHIYLTVTINNLAKLYVTQGKYEQAELLMQQALTMREQELGREHPDIANSLQNLARLHVAQDKYTEAEDLYRRAIAIREQRLGPTHKDLATTLYDLARLLLTQHGYETAKPYFERAMLIFEQVWEADHPDLVRLTEEYADLVRKVEREKGPSR